jgi:hypothetical protein
VFSQATTTTMFFMNPNVAGLRPSSDITVRNCRSSQTHADGISTSILLSTAAAVVCSSSNLDQDVRLELHCVLLLFCLPVKSPCIRVRAQTFTVSTATSL